MITLISSLLFSLLAWRKARQLQGNRMDQLQYAAAGLLAGFTIGIVLTLIADKLFLN